MPNLGNSRALLMRRRGGAAGGIIRPSAAFALGFNLCGLADQLAVASVSTLDSYLAYFQAHGFVNVRLPISWGRVQPISNGPLEATYLGVITGVLDAAAARGMRVLIDIHNYGNGPDGGLDGAQTISSFGDLWSKLAAALKNKPALRGYDLMNEWNNTPSGGTPNMTVAIMKQAIQTAITAIRGVDTHTTIYVEGFKEVAREIWTGAASGVSA